jgi:hypothetical protein
MTNSIQTIFNDFKKECEPLLEQMSKSKNITVIPLLFHIQANIAPWVTTKLYDRLTKFGNKIKGDVSVILFSKGGDPDTAFLIGKMLNRMTEGHLTFIIPRLAASAATLLALSGDRIIMGPPSELSPIDPQIEISPYRFVSARSVRESCDLILKEIMKHPEIPKSTVEAFLERLPLTEVIDYELLLEHMIELAVSLLKLRMVKEETKAKQIAEKLVRGFKYHGRSISIDDALELGLNVEELPLEEWNLVWEFHEKWEKVATITAKEGAAILDLSIGNGVAFIPNEEAEKEGGGKSILQSILTKE